MTPINVRISWVFFLSEFVVNIQQTVHMIHWQVGTSLCSGANYRHHFRRSKIPYNYQLKTSNVDFLRAFSRINLCNYLNLILNNHEIPTIANNAPIALNLSIIHLKDLLPLDVLPLLPPLLGLLHLVAASLGLQEQNKIINAQ